MTLAEDIINGTNIVDVIGRHVSLTKAGANYKGLCPFHGEKSPSFVVSPQKQIFKCFGCGMGGDVITFIKELDQVDFIEAAKILSKDAGVVVEEYQSKNYDPQIKDDKERTYEMNKIAKVYFGQELKKNPDALDYVRNARGLSDEIVAKFGVGYAPDSYYEMMEYMKAKGYDAQQQAQASLAKPSQRGDSYAFFRGRAMFPIMDARSRVVGFGGRAMGDAQPKYVNTTDTLIYDKSAVLYGINRAKSAVREQESIIVVEGYMDVIGLHRLGYEASVATCGTALTDQHMKTLKKYTDKVILLFDQDKAGFQATQRALSLAYSQDIYPLVMSLPEEYKDVDEVAQAVDQGTLSKPDLTTQTQDGLHFVIKHLQSKIDPASPIDKKRLLDSVFALVAMVSSISIQQHYLGLIAHELNMNESVILAEFQVFFSDKKRDFQKKARRSEGTEKEDTNTFQPSEDDLVAALFADHWIIEQLPEVEKVAALIERSDLVGSKVGGVLGASITGELTDEQKQAMESVQLRRESELDRTGDDQHIQYVSMMRRVGKTIQRLTQTALKLADPEQKSQLIKLLHNVR